MSGRTPSSPRRAQLPLRPGTPAAPPAHRRRATEFAARGDRMRAQRRHREAAECYRQALAYDATLAAAHVGLGMALWGLDRRAEAIARLEEAVAADPGGFEPARCLADAYWLSGQPAAAMKYYLQAAQANPHSAEVLSNLGALLRESGHPREALGALNRALSVEPHNPGILVNSGLVFQDLGDHAAALSCYDLALAADPAHEDARWNRAVALLATGDFERGWAAHEARATMIARAGLARAFDRPRWDGGPLDGRCILVHAEQGIGDQLQFVRFLPALKARGATVIVECHPALAALLAGVDGADEVVPQGGALPPFDVHAPVMSLPFLLGSGGALLGERVPYLRAPGAPDEAVRRIAAAPGVRVGLVWAGEPAHRNDRNRSADLAALAPLLDLPGTSWFSLQVGTPARALAALPDERRARIADLGTGFGDFADTARAVAALDLVIAVDTSVAHLAGALGRPVWLLLPFVADWRWQTRRADSPWYSTARLFRQETRGDWPGVARQLRAALAALAGSPDGPRAA